VSRNSAGRLGVYAARGVPEVWRFDGTVLECHLRDPGGACTRSDSSSCFPGLRPADLIPFVLRYNQTDENALVREIRVWVREQIAPEWGPTT
jgi:hypothetical protein